LGCGSFGTTRFDRGSLSNPEMGPSLVSVTPRFLDRGDSTVSVPRDMIAPVLLVFVEGPVFVKVTTGAQRPQPQDRLRARETPAGSGNVHAVLDQMSAGSLDHTGGNRKAGCQVLVIAQIRFVAEQISGTLVDGLALLASELAPRGLRG